MVSLSECISWMTVGLAESVAIVALNLCTIIVFIRNRNLRKRSTYLVMNLAVIDMFVGGVVVHNVFYTFGFFCNLWEWHFFEYWRCIPIEVLLFLFPIASLTNITIIALERVHASFCPLKHRVLKKWVYGLIIAEVWITSGLVLVSATLLFLLDKKYGTIFTYSIHLSQFVLLLFVFLTRILSLKSFVELSLNSMVQPVEKENYDIVDCDCCISSIVPAVCCYCTCHPYQ